MLVLVGMAIALGRTGAAESNASRQLRFQWLAVTRLVGARHDAAGGGADRRAVQIQPYAGDQALYVLFREASVRAGGAGFDAERAGVDARRDGVRMGRMLGMRSEHGAHD